MNNFWHCPCNANITNHYITYFKADINNWKCYESHLPHFYNENKHLDIIALSIMDLKWGRNDYLWPILLDAFTEINYNTSIKL